jgi:spore coat polysaccharide biosynthesis protein SpsF
VEQVEIVAITQARMSSSRLPGKVLRTLGDQSMLALHLQRILRSKRVQKLILATTTEISDDAVAAEGKKCGVEVSRGSLNDVLDRFYQAAMPYKPRWVIRLTADCPLADPVLIDQVLEKALSMNVDYCSNTLEPTFPDGMDVEVFSFSALKKAWSEASLPSDREHVTPYIYRNSDKKGGSMFKSAGCDNPVDFSQVRLTVDEPADLEVITTLIKVLGTDASWLEYSNYYLINNLNKLNSRHPRNEGYSNSLKKDNDQHL